MIKQSTDKLLTLINNVLDLSRLESGMMVFHKSHYDIQQLCNEAKMMAEMKNGRNIRLQLNLPQDNLQIYTDERWFIRVLTSLLLNTNPRATCKAECIVTVEDNLLKFVICNCPRYREKEDEQNLRIIHSINEQFIKQCNGEYLHYEEDNHQKILITLPLP